MNGLYNGGVRELNLLRNRTRRLYGLSRISMEQMNEILSLIDVMEQKFKETVKDDERQAEEITLSRSK
jgi:hypothetical protein